jgi:hypothetical protein
VILLSVMAGASPWLDADELSLPTPRRSHDVTLSGHDARPIYNGSVVPGGVYSLDELRTVIARDPVVAEHYRHADLGEMRAVTLTKGRAAYVSYRRGNRIFWTRGRVWLKPGETVLTDGTTTIRARCGNCVADIRQGDVAAVEPAHGELDEAVVPPTPETGVSPVSGEIEELGDLLEVPFAAQTLASLQPGPLVSMPDLLGRPFRTPELPGWGLIPLLPGGGGGAAPPGGPVVFLPPDRPGTETTGSVTTTGSTGLTPTTGTPTTGTPATGSPTTGSVTTGWVTTGALTTGSPTTGELTGEATTGTVTTGTKAAPEPGILWLVACGLFGLASRRLRGR